MCKVKSDDRLLLDGIRMRRLTYPKITKTQVSDGFTIFRTKLFMPPEIIFQKKAEWFIEMISLYYVNG